MPGLRRIFVQLQGAMTVACGHTAVIAMQKMGKKISKVGMFFSVECLRPFLPGGASTKTPAKRTGDTKTAKMVM
uniref:Uncharacterized protein n=1 Tax=Candidatus Kentrum sp. DK TaxID=2126562 RepID=A0A450TDQ4_9GAMM|nr:MAG: hypothetical protein BECKDK2373C_GA0170839_11266 [Candidatus Kentron sp. DK]